jgi:hypothetical protein
LLDASGHDVDHQGNTYADQQQERWELDAKRAWQRVRAALSAPGLLGTVLLRISPSRTGRSSERLFRRRGSPVRAAL